MFQSSFLHVSTSTKLLQLVEEQNRQFSGVISLTCFRCLPWDGMNRAPEAPSFPLKWISKDQLRHGDVLCRCLKIEEMNLVQTCQTCSLLRITTKLRWIISFKTYVLKWSENPSKEDDVSSCSKWKQNRALLLHNTQPGLRFYKLEWYDSKQKVCHCNCALFSPQLLNFPGGLFLGSVVLFLWPLSEGSSYFVQDH